jgi:AcrR family transcriptional regulator
MWQSDVLKSTTSYELLNKEAADVQKGAPKMRKHALERKPRSKRRKPDERIQRTHERLGAALVALIQEKPMDEVTVQDVLDRASVGRSTFYLHFSNKNDLLLSQLEDGLEMWTTALSKSREKSRRVAPVAEFFAHIAGAKTLYRALVDSGRIQVFFDLAEGYFARGIERRIKETRPLPRLPQRELAAQAFALGGGLLSLLRWWLDRGAKEPPGYMDKLFHRIVWNGLQ